MKNDKQKKYTSLNPEIVDKIKQDTKGIFNESQIIERIIMLHYLQETTERMKIVEQNKLILIKLDKIEQQLSNL